jgi:hypothetical protein
MPEQPDVLTYPLRPDQFQTLCDGEMSVSRSTRDACIGAFLTGAVGIAGVLLTIDWDEAARQGRHPLLWTVGLATLTGVAFIYGTVETISERRIKTNSSYSRLTDGLKEYFGLAKRTLGK